MLNNWARLLAWAPTPHRYVLDLLTVLPQEVGLEAVLSSRVGLQSCLLPFLRKGRLLLQRMEGRMEYPVGLGVFLRWLYASTRGVFSGRVLSNSRSPDIWDWIILGCRELVYGLQKVWYCFWPLTTEY